MTDVIDRGEILDRVGGDLELLLELIDIFREDSQSLVSEIQNAVRRKDAVRLRENAHTLKGSVGNFGAEEAFSAAAQLEAIGDGGDMSDAPQVFGMLETQMEQVRNALELFAWEISNENTRCGR